MQAASGGSDPLFVEDVFRTSLYIGQGGSTATIDNGIDLSGEGGLVWIKARNASENHVLFDTERGVTKYVSSNLPDAEGTSTGTLTNFYNNGFKVDGNGTVGSSTDPYVAWTWRKAKNFFDIQTFTKSSGEYVLNHNLGSVPGMVLLKQLDASYDWQVFHRRMHGSAPQDYGMRLNNTGIRDDGSLIWNDTAPTATTFTVGNQQAAGDYVAYLFAHHDNSGDYGESGDQDIIKCDTFGGSSGNQEVNLGFEPQFVMIKISNGTDTGSRGLNWIVTDTMRGAATSRGASDGKALWWNTTASEYTDQYINILPTGFQWVNSSEAPDYIYMAIRRGPMATPESASQVFGLNYYSGNSTNGRILTNSGNASDYTGDVDMAIINDASNSRIANRLTGVPFLVRNDYPQEVDSSTRFKGFDASNGIVLGSNSQVNGSGNNYAALMFSRAPGFFDIVTYTGTGSARTIPHSLGVVPEMMWIKSRDGSQPWSVYYGDNTDYLVLNENDATVDNNTYWNDTTPTSTGFSVGTANNTNQSNKKFVAYLFATLEGVSKVGTFTGNGGSLTVDCGFTSGARYVFVKRINGGTGDWMEFNTGYGIVSGNESGWRVNEGGIASGVDLIDPDNSGFIINHSSDGNYNTNISGSSYFFYAIA